MEVQAKAKKSHNLFLISALVLLLLALFLPSMFLIDCLTSVRTYSGLSNAGRVLGLTNFNVSPSKSAVTNNETFTYTVTLTSDSSQIEILTSSIVFELMGQGSVSGNIEGSGVCVRVNESRVTCTGIDLLPAQTLTWIIPVTAGSSCSTDVQSSLELFAAFAPNGNASEISEDSAAVSCIDPLTTSFPVETSIPVGDTQQEDGNNSRILRDGNNQVLTSNDVLAFINQHNREVKDCYSNKSLSLGAAILILVVSSFLIYFLKRK